MKACFSHLIVALAAGLAATAAFAQPAAVFGSNSATINNKYYPLSVGAKHVFKGTGENSGISVTHRATAVETVDGVSCIKVVCDDPFADGFLYEWFAQDTSGAVWRLHQYDTSVAEYDDEDYLIMPANPQVGQTFFLWLLEYEVVSTTAKITVPAGTFSGCLRLRCIDEGWLDGEEYFAPWVGEVTEFEAAGGWQLSSISGLVFPPSGLAQEHVSQALTAGVKYELGPFAGHEGLSGPFAYKVASGVLPAGMRAEVRTNGVYLTGVPTKAGLYQPVVQITAKMGAVAVPVANLAFDLPVAGLPGWAQGTFNGFISLGGQASMTVSPLGKVSGKVLAYGVTYNFSAASYMGGNATNGFTILALAKGGNTYYAVTLTVKQAEAPPGSALAFGRIGGNPQLSLWRDTWKESPEVLAPYLGYYTSTLPGGAEYGSGYLTLTVDAAGKVKASGKLADGTSVSSSCALIRDESLRVFAVLYAAPALYKGGIIAGLAQFVAPDLGPVYLKAIDGTVFPWENFNPLATENAAAGGFERYLQGYTGGWYDKTSNLYAYYAGKELSVATTTNAAAPELIVGTNRYGSVCWRPDGVALTAVTNRAGVMTGLAAPAAGKPTDPEQDGAWDYGAANAVGLKIGLARATGIFKGSFLAWFDYPDKKHVSKSLVFEGALTPVREDASDGVEGRGFFLWPDTAVPPPPAKPYSFKWSYDFQVQSADE